MYSKGTTNLRQIAARVLKISSDNYLHAMKRLLIFIVNDVRET